MPNKRNGKSWSGLLRNPFNSSPCHIPDDATMDSGVVTSKQLYQLVPSAIGGQGTVHTGGLLIMPHPFWYIYPLYEDLVGSQTLTDLNGGNAYLMGQTHASNVYGIFPNGISGRVRMTALGIRVTYEGTELNRAGRIFAGLCPIQFPAKGTATGTALSPLSTICGSPSSAISTMKQCMTNMVSARVSDGTFEVHWFPNGVPTYQSMAATSQGWLPYTTTNGAAVNPSAFNAPPGLGGVQGGQNVLVVFVENDVVTAAQGYGNMYTAEIVAHWEVIPSSPWSVPYSLSPSPYSSVQLQAALNAQRLQMGAVHEAPTMSTGRAEGRGTVTVVSDKGYVARAFDLASAASRASVNAWNRLDGTSRSLLENAMKQAAARAIENVGNRVARNRNELRKRKRNGRGN